MDSSQRSSTGVGKRIAANTGLLLGAKILAVIIGLGTILIATRFLTPAEFGIVVFLHAYMLFFSEVATFQSWQSIIRFGTENLRDDDRDGLARLICFGVSLDALSVVLAYVGSVLFFGLIVWIVGQFPDFDIGDGFSVRDLRNLAALYCLVIFFRMISTSIGVFRLFDKFHILAIKALIMPIVRFAFAVVAAVLGWGLYGFVLAWFLGSLTQYVYVSVAGLFELRRRKLLKRVFQNGLSLRSDREGLWPFVIKANIDSTLATGNMHLPQLMVMAMFGPVWNGVFKIAEEVAKLLTEGFKLLDQVIYPELAKLVSDGQAQKIWRIVLRAAIVLLSVGVAFSVLIYAFGGPALAVIFGAEYGEAAGLASLLVPAAALMGVAAPLYPVFYAANRPERAIYIRGLGLLFYVISFIGLGVTIGRMSPGWAALIGNFTAVVCLIVVARLTLRGTVKRQMGTSSRP